MKVMRSVTVYCSEKRTLTVDACIPKCCAEAVGESGKRGGREGKKWQQVGAVTAELWVHTCTNVVIISTCVVLILFAIGTSVSRDIITIVTILIGATHTVTAPHTPMLRILQLLSATFCSHCWLTSEVKARMSVHW